MSNATIVLAAKAGYFGSARERKYQKAQQPYAVYIVENGVAKYLPCDTAEFARERAQRIAARRGADYDDRTEEDVNT